MLIAQITTHYVKKSVNLPSGSITNTPYFSVLYYYFGGLIMKVVLLVIIGVLVFQSEDSRFFISDQLQNASELIRPESKFMNIRY